MADGFAHELQRFGALPGQLVDLAARSARTVRFADLLRSPESGRAPVVVEAQGRPLLYAFDARDGAPPEQIKGWVRRVAFRGDADWVGVLHPGHLDVHPAVLGNEELALRPIDLPEGPFRIPALLHRQGVEAPSVRSRLRTLLFESIRRARDEFELSPRDSFALVGGALFWRFLVDRRLLDGLDPSDIAEGATTWESCLDRKVRALKTFRWLDVTFNGGLLRFDTPREALPAAAFQRIAGDIAHKADAGGQLSLPQSWAQFDFAHVPVGLLSEVYEAVSHDGDAERATEKSLFYTPRHLAEYVVDEVLDRLGDVEHPRLLDPAAGAGVFLVAAFRALVAREWDQHGPPTRRIVRRILEKQLAGFDIDGDALRLAELALYLTAIELDPDKRPRPLSLLKFTSLQGTVLVEQAGGPAQGSLGPVPEELKAQFDAVVGNPPWTAAKGRNAGGKNVKKPWADASRAIVEQRLGKERAKAFKFPDVNPDLPFVYRAMEWVRPGGVIGLITHARWLFGQSAPAVQARNDLLESVHVTGVLNGSALRQTRVWPNVAAPFCILFATNEPPPEWAALQFASPEFDTADGSQDRLRIDWGSLSEIEVRDVVERPWALKARFRGNAVDESVIYDLGRVGVPLEEYLRELGTKPENGYQATASDEQTSAAHMKDWPDLRGSDLDFLIEHRRLPAFTRDQLHRPRKEAIYAPPLLVVHESMVVGGTRPRSGLALARIAYDERFDGISFASVSDGTAIARWLQLVLQSSVFTHALLMLDGQFGIEREVVHLETIKRVPVVPWAMLSPEERRKALALSKRLHRGNDEALQAEIDRLVARAFRLSRVQLEAIRDTLATALPTAESRRLAVRLTRPDDREAFASTCQEALRDVLAASKRTAHVRARDDLSTAPWRFVQVDRVAPGAGPLPDARLPLKTFLEAADEGGASLVTLRASEATTLVGILDRYRYWTPTRGGLLAGNLLSGPSR